MAATVAPKAIVLEVLNQNNYEEWSFRVETYLLAEGLWDVVEFTGQESKDDWWWEKQNAMALHAIQISCGTEMFSVISGIREAKLAWDTLKKSFMPGILLSINADKRSPHIANDNEQPKLDDVSLLRTTSYRGRKYGRVVLCQSQGIEEFKTDKSSPRTASDDGQPELDDELSFQIKDPSAILQKDSYKDSREFESDKRSPHIANDNGQPELDDDSFVQQKANDKYKPIVVMQSGKIVKSGTDKRSPHIANDNEQPKLDDVSLLRTTSYRDRKYGRAVLCQSKGIEEFKTDKRSPRNANDDGQPELEDGLSLPIKDHKTSINNFMNYVKRGNWNSAETFLTEDGDAVRASPLYRREALRVAIRRHAPEELVKKLVDLMTNEDLEKNDGSGFNVFADALHEGRTQIVIHMAKKNKNLPTMRLPPQDFIPVLVAACLGHWEMARDLYDLAPPHVLTAEDGRDCAQLISEGFAAKQYDIAWDLIHRYPKLVFARNYFGLCPLNVLAGLHFGFFSGVRLKFWQKWIYDCIYIEGLVNDNGNRRTRICSVMGLLRRLVMKLKLLDMKLKLLGINHIYEMKLTHTRSLEFLRSMRTIAKKGNCDEMQHKFIEAAIFQAVERGHVEFIIHMCKAVPKLLGTTDGKGRNIFHYAINCRQEKVYYYMHVLDKVDFNGIRNSADKFNNSILHEAANLSTQLRQIQGAPLQMQRELQWFKEVESIVPSKIHEMPNFTDRMTARELFTKNHEKLMKEAEISMKETATSCTVIGALIVTIMFAAAFTVPGGNNEDTGAPIFLNKTLFRVFIVSVAISLFSSLTSVIIFLGLLTSRYSEDDFLMSLPTKMIIGLTTLFLSITTMMIAFSSTIFIMLHEQSLNIVITVISMAWVPIISFVWMHFSLFFETSISTYGKGLFADKKKVKRWYEIIDGTE